MISDPQEKTWGMACHLAALAGLVVPWVGFFLGPLVVWLVKKDQYAFVDDQGKEALNFQISLLVYTIAAAVLCVTIILIPLVWVFIIALHVFNVVMVILAGVAANNGQYYRYPVNLRFIR